MSGNFNVGKALVQARSTRSQTCTDPWPHFSFFHSCKVFSWSLATAVQCFSSGSSGAFPLHFSPVISGTPAYCKSCQCALREIHTAKERIPSQAPNTALMAIFVSWSLLCLLPVLPTLHVTKKCSNSFWIWNMLLPFLWVCVCTASVRWCTRYNECFTKSLEKLIRVTKLSIYLTYP